MNPLLDMWGEDSVQSQLDGIAKNKTDGVARSKTKVHKLKVTHIQSIPLQLPLFFEPLQSPS